MSELKNYLGQPPTPTPTQETPLLTNEIVAMHETPLFCYIAPPPLIRSVASPIVKSERANEGYFITVIRMYKCTNWTRLDVYCH